VAPPMSEHQKMLSDLWDKHCAYEFDPSQKVRPPTPPTVLYFKVVCFDRSCVVSLVCRGDSCVVGVCTTKLVASYVPRVRMAGVCMGCPAWHMCA
jgi:hypothetical protein